MRDKRVFTADGSHGLDLLLIDELAAVDTVLLACDVVMSRLLAQLRA